MKNMLRLKCSFATSLLLALLLATWPLSALADYSASPSYQVNETFFGAGGQLCNPGVSGYSTNYCASSSLGETAVGNPSSTNYQAHGGFNTDQQPYLYFTVNNASSTDLGELTQRRNCLLWRRSGER